MYYIRNIQVTHTTDRDYFTFSPNLVMTVAQSGSYHNVPFAVQAVQSNESVIICSSFTQ